jgi:hypothetical protein
MVDIPDSTWQHVPTYLWRYFDTANNLVAVSLGDGPVNWWDLPAIVRQRVVRIEAFLVTERGPAAE